MSDGKSWPAGFLINPHVTTLPADLVAAYKSVPAAHASDCLGRCVGGIDLRAYHCSFTLTMAGPALTVRTRPGDNLMIHKAIALALPGQVIVIDGGGDVSQALIGGLMRTSAMTRNVEGFVVDGAVRDLAEWADGKMPVYARGHTHRGPSKDGPGEINVPIACAGMVVNPGDLVLGDADEVIVIPAAQAKVLLPLARAHAAKEVKARAENAAGTADPERFNAILRAKGCPV